VTSDEEVTGTGRALWTVQNQRSCHWKIQTALPQVASHQQNVTITAFKSQGVLEIPITETRMRYRRRSWADLLCQPIHQLDFPAIYDRWATSTSEIHTPPNLPSPDGISSKELEPLLKEPKPGLPLVCPPAVRQILNEQPEVVLVVLEFSIRFAIELTDQLGAVLRNFLILFYNCRIKTADRLDADLWKPLHHALMRWGHFAALEVVSVT
jgi:hypothetical protein